MPDYKIKEEKYRTLPKLERRLQIGSLASNHMTCDGIKSNTSEIRCDERSFSHLRNTELNPFSIGYEIRGGRHYAEQI